MCEESREVKTMNLLAHHMHAKKRVVCSESCPKATPKGCVLQTVNSHTQLLLEGNLTVGLLLDDQLTVIDKHHVGGVLILSASSRIC